MHAIFAFLTNFGIPSAARPRLRAYPCNTDDSFKLFPCAFKMLIALIGYLTSPMSLYVLMLMHASTTKSAKKSSSAPMIFELMLVFAHCNKASFPSVSTSLANLASTYLTLSRIANLNPAMMFVG